MIRYSFLVANLIIFFNASALVVSPDLWKTNILFPEPVNDKVTVEKHNKLELGLSVPHWFYHQVEAFVRKSDDETHRNPFDSDKINIEAEFMHVGNYDGDKPVYDIQRKSYGFYYKEFQRSRASKSDSTFNGWSPVFNEYIFRVRFAPEKIGNWRCILTVKLDGKIAYQHSDIYFEVIESNRSGVVSTSTVNGNAQQFLKFKDSGKTFFPVGMNLLWTNLLELTPNDFATYEKWFNQLGKVKANYVQLSSLPFTYGVEWETPGDYSLRMTQAWEMDQLINEVEKKEIYVNLITLIHDEFMNIEKMWIHKNNHWSNNGYNAKKNGGVTNANQQLDFFTDEKCKMFFKRRLRYILARYGYSPNLPIIELLSEVDNAIPNYNDKNENGKKIRKAFNDWFIEMRNYIKNDLGYSDKLVSVSYTQSDQNKDIENGVFPFADLILLHFYGRDKQTNFKNRYQEHVLPFRNSKSTQYKPILFDEMGANVFPGLESCTDITFHNNLWATSFMGCFGSGQNWWWDNALLKKGYEKNMKGLQEFLRNEDFSLAEMSANAATNKKNKFKSKSVFEWYYLTSNDKLKVTGWVHNTSFFWANQKNSNECVATMIKNNNGSHIELADNSQYAKEYIKNGAQGNFKSFDGYKIKFQLLPKTEYMIKWYSTSAGELMSFNQRATSNGSGKIQFDIPNEINSELYGDFGFKIVKFSK